MSWPFQRFSTIPGTYRSYYPNAILANGTTIGEATTDTCTCTGRLIFRTVDDTGMTATAGTQGEVVFNSDDSTFYGCTVTSTTAATWVALN